MKLRQIGPIVDWQTVLAAWAGKQTMMAAWAGYEEEEIPDRSRPVLIGRCEITLVVRQKASMAIRTPRGV